MIEEVVQDVQWTPSAKNSFNKIVVYLRREWTEKEVERFIERTEKMINSLKCYPDWIQVLNTEILKPHSRAFHRPSGRGVEYTAFNK